MPVRHPRRIFRSSGRRSAAPVLLLCGAALGVVGLGAAGLAGAAWLLPPRSAPAGAPTGDVIEVGPQQVAVVDGETLRLRDVVVRLQGVQAPERAGCDPSADCGAAASAILASLVRQHGVRCHLAGQDEAGRPLGRCRTDLVELNRGVVERGGARADPANPWLAPAEAEARAAHRGLWAARP